MSDTEAKLRKALARLETTAQSIIKTRGYTGDARALKMLEELIKEQLLGQNESRRNSTRTVR